MPHDLRFGEDRFQSDTGQLWFRGHGIANTLAVRLGADLAAADVPKIKAAADEAWQRTIDWFNKYARA